MAGETGMGEKRTGKFLTAAVLGVIALSLFLFTLYNGLK